MSRAELFMRVQCKVDRLKSELRKCKAEAKNWKQAYADAIGTTEVWIGRAKKAELKVKDLDLIVLKLSKTI